MPGSLKVGAGAVVGSVINNEMNIRMYPTDGLKGQQANSPGRCPGLMSHCPLGAVSDRYE